MLERLLKPREFCEIVGISYRTFKRWVSEGRVSVVRTPSGRMRVPYSEVERILGGRPEAREVRAVVYARVSSSDQRSDLERQVQYLTQYCSARGYRVVDVLTDIASGLKADRRGLLKLFEYVVSKQVDVVVITYRDRLTRFGFEYLEYFFRQYGVRIEVIYGDEPKDARQELVEDLLSIVTSFAGKLYGLRSHRKKRLVEGFKKLVEEVEKGGGESS
ncbi:IS element ISDka1 orfA, putative resolvase [Desulfurococcus amylolyticus 1221n]|uniref:IS element ISDka1 orfA, putative resolvase n=1 Tax=Desulfurococcus amylolyticus (strain DSM 18924 / JCM 16383 / VKM B-2413 / 1221n) TaxID=490899 RepID=B8D6R8_DESA1|nr:IS607-like element ISDka1 family transposase [Desulfurococcus amylolyticus]ACL11799.1 IS element ISDka1 orfA, putative resolvase [Desulfurococcus amylolyticus 1221n]